MRNDEGLLLQSLFSPLTIFKSVCCIVIIGIIVYFNSLFGAFVWDDINQIVKNDKVHSISNIANFFAGSTFGQDNSPLLGLYYRPLMTSSFSIIHSIFGPQPFFLHSFQLFVHILNAILLFLLF